MLVKDIMHTEVKTATPDTRIRDVAVVMCLHKISGVPVVDSDNTIIGVLSEKDILKAMYPDVAEYMQNGRPDFEGLEGRYHDVLNRRVGDLMTSKVFTVSPEIPVLKAVSIMVVHKIRRIPVAENGKLVGIISIGDVHKAIFQTSLDAARRAESHGTDTAGMIGRQPKAEAARPVGTRTH